MIKKNMFELMLDGIDKVQNSIKDMTFEQAKKELGGYNCDGELFDYDWDIDGERYMVGTILNDRGKPKMSYDDNFYELWEHESDCFETQTLSMTEKEIREQVERLE